MSSRFRPREEPGLFDDLPLQQETPHSQTPVVTKESKAHPAPKPPPAPTPESLPLFDEEATTAPPVDTASHQAARSIVPFEAHLTAGLVDLGVMLGVLLVIGVGLWWLDVDVDLVDRVLVLVFLMPFSFLYQIFPLAFWGCTPGMAKVGIVARNKDGQTLSFSQAALRWVASVLTVASVGLPLILTATTGRSLADRLSGSQTLPAK